MLSDLIHAWHTVTAITSKVVAVGLVLAFPSYFLYEAYIAGPEKRRVSDDGSGSADDGRPVHSIYGDDTKVKEGDQPPHLPLTPPEQGQTDAARYYKGRTYQLRRWTPEGVWIGDLDYTVPTDPAGNPYNPEEGWPHYHKGSQQDPYRPGIWYPRGKAQRNPPEGW